MTRVLVTGANGFVGRTLCPALAAAGHEVSAALRKAVTVVDPSFSAIHTIGEIGPQTDWIPALEGVGAVVHLAARVHVTRDDAADPLAQHRRVNTQGTRRLAEAAAAAGVKRFVFVSTIKVNGEGTGASPFRSTDPAAPQDPYGIAKLEAEQALFDVAEETGIEVVVVRPPLMYGPGVKGNFLSLLRLCAYAPPLPFAAVTNRRSLLYVGNLADAVGRCLTRPEAANRVFLLSDGDDVSTPDLIRRTAEALGRPSRLFPVAPALLRAAGRVTGKSAALSRLLDSLTVDGDEVRRDLGWIPPFTLSQGLRETATWFTSCHGRNAG